MNRDKSKKLINVFHPCLSCLSLLIFFHFFQPFNSHISLNEISSRLFSGTSFAA
jgi:hypothetical protein